MAETIEELEARQAAPDCVDAEFVEDDPDDPTAAEVIDNAVLLLKTCRCLLEYFANRDLCIAISRRERDTSARVADRISTYLDELETRFLEE